ncbi:Glycine cleavage system H protein [Candidatus Calditenuaceae archaeon HR02]|nr:Glycine cleavage system H protein [Candidatus Calditenuaceae archaeon HR02]
MVEEIQACGFSSNHLYFLEEMLWLSPIRDRVFRVGILPITQTLWGKVTSVSVKQPGDEVAANRAICLIESRRFLGNVRAPFDLRIERLNMEAVERPWILQRGFGEAAWLCEVAALEDNCLTRLKSWSEIRGEVERMISEKGIICFREVPDYVHAAIGIDCSQLLMVLSDKLEGLPEGSIIHIVADYNEGAEKDLEKWSRITGNEVLDFRVEKRLAHALIRRRTQF